ncbi:MAG: glycosyltransferase family 25 protein, partial [Sphingomonadales bacterium]
SSSRFFCALTNNLTQQLAGKAPFPLVAVDAVFPAITRIPFLAKLLRLAKQRTGYPMQAAELGCLLGHRKIWRMILAENSGAGKHYLVLESDSQIQDMNWLTRNFDALTTGSDLFFWGAFDGRIKLFSSSATKVDDTHRVGEPLINSLYCTYGYSLTSQTAALLLRKTAHLTYPVDHFKRFFSRGEISILGILPQAICSTNAGGSQTRPGLQSNLFDLLFDRLIDLKNDLLTRFR